MPTSKQHFLHNTNFSFPVGSYSNLAKTDFSQNTELFEKIITHVPSLIAVYNVNNGKYVFVNDSIQKILGYSKEALLKGGLPFLISLIHPLDINELMAESNQAIKKINDKKNIKAGNNLIATFEYRIKHRDGSWRWLHTDGVIFDRNKSGKVEQVMNISIDITKRKETEIKETEKRKISEENFKSNEEKFEALLKHSSDAISLLDISGRRIYATPSRRNILGYDLGDDFGGNVFDYVHPEDKEFVLKSFKKLCKEPNKSLTMTFRIRHKNGGWVWIETIGTNLLDVPEIKAIVVNYRNVTERKKAEEKSIFLEKATEILISSLDYETTLNNIVRLVVPKLADYCRIVVYGADGEVKEVSLNHVNPKKISLVGRLYEQYKNDQRMPYGIDRILVTGKAEIIPKLTPDVLEVVKDQPSILKTLSELKINSYIGVPLKARGKIIGAMTFSSTKSNFSYTQKDLQFAKELAYRVAISLDNAQLYANEQQAVKLRDNFISMASHELKTPITSIKGFVQIAQSQSTDSKSKFYLSRLDNQINKLTSLINDLLDVSKIQSGKLDLIKEPININEFLQEIVSDMQQISDDHKILFNDSTEKSDIIFLADRYRLNQVIVNLITNATKYSPHAQKIIVSSLIKGDQLFIEVQDYGIGISNKNISRIFEPFYQVDIKVRQSFGGLGLGLHISREIIKRHGGRIDVTSKKGVGSTFTITLPLI